MGHKVGHISRNSAYLQTSRHGVYYFRQRVPVALVDSLSCTHIKRSLQTSDRRCAFMSSSVVLERAGRL
ncbi:DUF6538 domain-containing protein [Reinekea marinisedimentorum]|uniref:DUF6538 domain-containing protein n=1 Tax=Reinekea marinisedimentorum TaxID=230495 RepID=UPI003C73956B